jgi:hypothetical protein
MRQSRWTRPRPRWLDVGVPALLVLAVAIPTMAVEEDWHGRPMIEQPGLLWLAAAFLVAGAFLVGGMAAGYRRPSAPARHATVAADLAVGVLLVGAVSRRLWLAHKGVPFAVVRLWCLGAVAALLLSAAGSQLGRWLAVRALSPLLARGKSDPAPPDDSRWWR